MSLRQELEKDVPDLGFGPVNPGYSGEEPGDILRIPFMTRLGRWLSPLLLGVFDYFSITIGLLLAFRLRNLLLSDNILSIRSFGRYIYLVIPMIYLCLIAYEGLYSKRLPLWQKIEKISKISFFATVLTAVLLYFGQVANFFPRFFWALSFVTCTILLIIERYFMKHLLVAAGLWKKPVLLIGAGRSAELLTTAFEEDSHIGYEVIGVFDDNHLRPLLRDYQYLGGLANLETVVRESKIRDALIAIPGLAREKLLDIVYRIQPYVKNISVVPDLFGLPLTNVEVNTYFRQKTVTLTLCNNLLNIGNRLVKRGSDLAVGIIFFLLAFPVMLVITVLVKLDSPGPVFHNARRIGQKGKEFICYKFRTMYVNGDTILAEYFAQNPEAREEWRRFAKLKNGDPRVTRVGKLLRKFSFDELPQFINVLIGNMSLVGPRPYLPREKEQMSYFFDTIVEAKPGITGFWQVSGRNDVEFTGRLELDAWYVRNWSFWLDITMLLKTVKVVYGKMGAY
jgi:Undecaprenyl-phosphate galactose phosphotransferase WbaP